MHTLLHKKKEKIYQNYKGQILKMHLILSYCKSHIYDLHALLAATITFFLMFGLKIPIKNRIEAWIKKKIEVNIAWEHKYQQYKKKAHILIILLVIILAGAIFGIISYISPLIHFSWHMMGMSGVFALAEYAIYDQLQIGRK